MKRRISLTLPKTLFLIMLTTFIALVCIISFGTKRSFAKEEKSYKVTASALRIREQPNTKSKILGRYVRGTVITGEAFNGTWVKIDYEGKSAYLCSNYLREIRNTSSSSSTANNEVTSNCDESVRYKTTTYLNVRKGPGTNYEKIGMLSPCQVIVPLGITDNNWYNITYDGNTAYVCGDYVVSYTPLLNSDGMSDDPYDYTIVINTYYCTLHVYYQNALWHEFDCGPGKASTPTPEGCFTIANKFVNPAYGSIPGGSSNNPLGKRWMGLSVPGTGGGTYGIHGTNNESSIGGNVSHGCVRMHNEEVEALYDVLPIGTTVIIKNSDSDDITIASEYGYTLTN